MINLCQFFEFSNKFYPKTKHDSSAVSVSKNLLVKSTVRLQTRLLDNHKQTDNEQKEKNENIHICSQTTTVLVSSATIQ